MEPEKKPRKVRFISGPPALVDAQVNDLIPEYGIVSINFATTGEGVIVTLYLIHTSVLGQMQIASGVANGGQRR
jgi:hypothetical protein